MQIPQKPITKQELELIIKKFLERCKKQGNGIICGKCGGSIRIGFINCFSADKNESLNPGHDGFGLGPKKVPYCENCDPPDGFDYTYTRRVGIII